VKEKIDDKYHLKESWKSSNLYCS